MLSMAHPIHQARGGGYSHNKTYGNVSLYSMFNKKSLNIGPIFYKKKKKKSLNMGPSFQFFFGGGCSQLHMAKIVKSGLYSEKNP